MINLINRIAFLLSLTFGYIVAILILFNFGISSHFGSGSTFFILFFGTIIGMIFKAFLLSESFIRQTVLEYSNKIILKAGSKGINTEQIKKEEIHNEYKTPQINLEEDEIEEFEELTEENIYSYNDAKINENIHNIKVEEKIPDEPKILDEPNFIEKFFAENALAKIGGILLFLGVLFFLSLLYTSAGPVAKIIIGFVTGFSFFGIGVYLDKIGYKNESRTLLGVGMLVNYLVILSGRYLIGQGNPIIGSDSAIINQNTNNILKEGTTFLFLILNTIFAVVTSLVYKSKTLLLFSFVFAYLNPFLIGSAGDGTPYTLVGYSFIVSVGAIILSYIYNNDGDKDFARYLNFVAFIGGNILFLLAPFGNAFQWLIKLIFLGIISMSSIILSYKNKDFDNVGLLFIMSYIAFAILLITGGSHNILHTGLAFLGYVSFILITLGITVFIITVGSLISISYILFAPLILIFGLLVTGSLYFIVPVIIGSLFIYLITFSFLFEILSASFKYLFFVLLCVFLILSNVSLKFVIPTGMDYVTHISMAISSIIFLGAAYFFSGKEKLEYLYSVGTIGTIFLLIPIIETKGELSVISILAITIFAIANIILPFINRNLSLKELKNLAISLVAGIIFIGGELYNFGEIAKLFPGITLGFAFMGLAIIYFLLGYFMMNILDIDFSPKSLTDNENKKNAIFGYLGVSISLFSIAILVMFSDKPAIIASIWFFESTILFFFFARIKDIKIFLGALILFLIGIFRYSTFIGKLSEGVYTQLIPLTAIFTSFILNIKFLEKTDEEVKIPHDILHLIAILMLGIGVINIVPNTGEGFSILAISIVMIIIGFFYNLFASNILKYAFIFVIGIFYLFHIFSLDNIYLVLENGNKENLKFLQYLVVILIGVWFYFRSIIGGKFDENKKIFKYSIYSLCFYNYYNFFIGFELKKYFSITIYWAIWAFAYIYNGISSDKQVRRTIGLYILSGVIAKILLYDVWFGINDAILRVVALMFVGGLMIYISTLYSRKYSGSLLGEFSFNNFGETQVNLGNKKQEVEKIIPKSENTNPFINQKISDINVENLNFAIFKVSTGKVYKIKSKNLIKIAKMVINNFSKSSFDKGELEEVYNYVVNNYKTELNATDFEKVKTIIKEFVQEGGSVILE